MNKLFGLRYVIIARNKFCKYANYVVSIIRFFTFCVQVQLRELVRWIDYSMNFFCPNIVTHVTPNIT